jgi:transcriptional regulator with XRE-family HTH domain
MKLSQKISTLRKEQGLSQEELARELLVSRQSVSRWEQGTAMPDAENLLRLSQIFGVTADYLLHDEYTGDHDLPPLQETKQNHIRQILFYLVLLEIMAVVMQFMTFLILQNAFFGLLSCIPILAMIGGFEYAYQKSGNETSRSVRLRFYKITAWLGLYFPIRFLVTIPSRFYPRSFSSLVLEAIILIIYIASAMLISLRLDESEL